MLGVAFLHLKIEEGTELSLADQRTARRDQTMSVTWILRLSLEKQLSFVSMNSISYTGHL